MERKIALLPVGPAARDLPGRSTVNDYSAAAITTKRGSHPSGVLHKTSQEAGEVCLTAAIIDGQAARVRKGDIDRSADDDAAFLRA